MKPGELGGRGDIGRTKVGDAGPVKSSDEFGDSSEEPSVPGAENSVFPGGGVWWTWESTLSGATGGEA